MILYDAVRTSSHHARSKASSPKTEGHRVASVRQCSYVNELMGALPSTRFGLRHSPAPIKGFIAKERPISGCYRMPTQFTRIPRPCPRRNCVDHARRQHASLVALGLASSPRVLINVVGIVRLSPGQGVPSISYRAR
jgi:hypothetical protein